MILTELTAAAAKLNPANQQAALDYILALLADQDAAAEPTPDQAALGSTGNGKRKAGGWVEVKTISGHPYAYRRWREGKTLKSEYIGKVKV
jgi:hypothetical protein